MAKAQWHAGEPPAGVDRVLLGRGYNDGSIRIDTIALRDISPRGGEVVWYSWGGQSANVEWLSHWYWTEIPEPEVPEELSAELKRKAEEYVRIFARSA